MQYPIITNIGYGTDAHRCPAGGGLQILHFALIDITSLNVPLGK